MNKYYPYEQISLVVVKRVNKKKVFGLLIIVLAILLLVLLYIANIHRKMLEISKDNNYNDIVEYDDNYSDMQYNIIAEANIPEESENKIVTPLPVLTQAGRDNMENIYITDEKVAYLTFDDGPSSNVTPQILNILDQYQVKATFFVLGCNVVRYPDLVKKEYESGHYIANHGYTHAYETVYSSSQSVLDEYIRTQQAIRDAIGIQEYCCHLFRFPGGTGGTKYRAVKNEAKQLLSDNDVLYIDWNALTNDAVGKPTEESIINDLISSVGTKNSVVILMHDNASKQLTANMLPHVLNYLIGQGYKFKTFYDVIM